MNEETNEMVSDYLSISTATWHRCQHKHINKLYTKLHSYTIMTRIHVNELSFNDYKLHKSGKVVGMAMQ